MEAAALPQSEDYHDPIIVKHEEMSPWAIKQYLDKYSWKDEDGEPTEVWPDTAYRVVRHVLGVLNYTDHDPEFQALLKFIVERKFIPGGRFLANAGHQEHVINNCFLYRCPDSLDGWADTVAKTIKATGRGGGVGVVYSDVRPEGTTIKKRGGFGTGPITPMEMVNDDNRRIKGGGHRRAAIWAGLHWYHDDIFKFIHLKDWPDEIKALKAKAAKEGKEFPAPMDLTNISVILDSDFFFAFENTNHPKHNWAKKVYWEAVSNMVSTGEPGFSIDVGSNAKENLRNPCCEITSEDDSDVCCLGHINMARVTDKEEFAELTRLGELFLIAGTVYSDVPHDEVKYTREKNRRTGLGLMGGHEWLLRRGYKYEMVPELESWLDTYVAESDDAATHYATKHNLTVPVKKRAIAPTGTTGILGETTTSWEPIPAVAYKRRFLDNDGVWRNQYVIDPTANRLIEEGVDPDNIEDAYALAYNVERRIKMQAEIQRYVDHAISSTINLPYPITDEAEVKDFAVTLYKYLPKLRGITCYPNGSRAGQPIEPVPYHVAHGKTGYTFEDNREDQCRNGVCGV